MTPLEQAREALRLALPVLAGEHDTDSARHEAESAIRAALASLDAAGGGVEPTDERNDPAPPNSLPTWDDCALRVSNSDFIAKRVAEGGYGAEPDSLLATELHRFIYEYDDADPYRSAWFLHRLELVLAEARSASPSVPAEGVQRDAERYRWLRSQFVSENVNSIDPPYWRTDLRCDLEGETFDEAVDAAMQSTNGGKP